MRHIRKHTFKLRPAYDTKEYPWSSIELETTYTLTPDSRFFDVRAVVIQVSGEHSNPDWVGKTIRYRVGPSPEGNLYGVAGHDIMFSAMLEQLGIPWQRWEIIPYAEQTSA